MNETRIKVGMVGAGYILKPHALAVAAIDGATLHAVADTSERRAVDAARQLGFAHAFTSVEAIAASDCDVVHVLVPPFLHLDIAETLLKAGKAVFLEKPMGLSSADCRRLGALADEKGVRLGVNHNFLFLPAYERLRASVGEGELGRVDHVTCNWHSELPQLRSGPFDTWMLGAPANLFFEVGPHLAGFILDLLGGAEVSVASASNPIDLPTGQIAFRSWNALGRHGAATFTASLSTSPGQADRLVRVRASGGSAQLDFGKDFAWEERTEAANPIFDAYRVARGISRQVGAAATKDRRRRLVAALRKSVTSTPFTESIFRSVNCFYSSLDGTADPRQHWSFGADVIEFCEGVCAAADVGGPSAKPSKLAAKNLAPSVAPTILVAGGSGFIGRRLVARLVAQGYSVRVLSRSKSAAAIAFSGTPVEIHEGFHGNRDDAKAALAGIEAVYHLAKCDGQNWGDYVRGDIEPTRVLAEEAIAAGVKRFIYTGTIDSHDSASSRKRITGDTPVDRAIGRRNLYARSKAACEALLEDLRRTQGLPLIVFRPGIVIGEGANPQHLGVAQFASETEVSFWGRGDNKLPLVLVDDVAGALAGAAAAPGIVGKTFLLTSEPLLSARDYLAEYSARAGVKVRASEHSPWRYWLADMVKELAKNLVRHPNRRWPSLHDWRCRTQRSTYDSAATRHALEWRPASDRQTMVEQGIHAAVDAALADSSSART